MLILCCAGGPSVPNWILLLPRTLPRSHGSLQGAVDAESSFAEVAAVELGPGSDSGSDFGPGSLEI